MKLIDNWRALWPKLSSVQLALVASVFDMCALGAVTVGELVPFWWRFGLGLAGIVLTLGSAVARLVVQEQVRSLDALLTAQKDWVDRGEA